MSLNVPAWEQLKGKETDEEYIQKAKEMFFYLRTGGGGVCVEMKPAMISSSTDGYLQLPFSRAFPWRTTLASVGGLAAVRFSIIPSDDVASWILFITFVPATNPRRQSKWDLIFQCFIRLSFLVSSRNI